MKTFFLQLCTASFLSLIFLFGPVNAQPSQLTNGNGTLLCPGRLYSFSSTSAPSTQNCSVNWTVTGGTTLLPNPTNAGIMNVSFDDVPGGKATLRTAYTNCTSTAANGQSPTLVIFIRSIKDLPLGDITLNGSTTGSIEFGSTTPVTLEVPYLTIPRHVDEINPVTRLAEGYEWTIPTGWLWPDGTTSNNTPRLFNSRNVSSPNRIVVTPSANACTGATPIITVKAVDTECSIGAVQGYVPTKSLPKSVTVNCIVPTLTIVTNKTPSGGNFSLFCGDGSNYGFRYVTSPSPLPAGGSFTFNTTAGDKWQASAPMLLIFGTTSATPGIVASGSGTGTVNLTMTYTRNGATTRVSATPVTVTVASQTEPPTLPGGPKGVQCNGFEDFVFTANKPANLKLRWSADSDVTINGQNPYDAPNTSETQVTLRINSTNYGSRRVSVQTFTNGCSPSGAASVLFAFGPPGPIQLTGVVTPIQRNGVMYLTIQNPNPALTYTWYCAGNTLNVAPNGLSATLYAKTDGNNTLYVSAGNECGAADFVQNFYVNPPGGFRLQATPNPANDALELNPATPDEAYSATLYDGQGQAVRQLREGSGRRTLDTRRLPSGLYWLVSQDAAGQLSRQTVQVSH